MTNMRASYKILSRLVLLLVLLLILIPLSAQERVIGLEDNPGLTEVGINIPAVRKGPVTEDTLQLPFFDDFYSGNPYPSPQRWSDREVYINNTYPIEPVSIGVATFDALNSQGKIHQNASTYPFRSDTLTSLPLDLSIAGENDTWLSFFYQAGGLGEMPNQEDSLVVEFWSSTEGNWETVWSARGQDSLSSPGRFERVMLPVDSLKYRHKGFRFRFSNYASLSRNEDDPGRITNCDHWNLDYVYLNTGRSAYDTVPRDVVMAEPLGSLLNNHESMPWKHFKKNIYNEMGGGIPIEYTNQDTAGRNITRAFTIWDVHQDKEVYSFTSGARNISPWQKVSEYADLLLNFETESEDSALFKINAWLVTDDFDRKCNDTVEYFQEFGDHFAYDDGTAEGGYGYSGGGSRASIAYRFRSYVPDSLSGLDIYFNRSYNDVNIVDFDLRVWADNNGVPGDLLYSKPGHKPEYADSLNAFIRYEFDNKVFVDGVFYVGWKQTSDIFLNVGYDVNRENKGRLLYRDGGEWSFSAFDGAIMLRPVMALAGTGTFVAEQEELQGYNIYPNPVGDVLNIGYEGIMLPGDLKISIYNSMGTLVRRYRDISRDIDVSRLLPGFYMLQIEQGNRSTVKKFIKSR